MARKYVPRPTDTFSAEWFAEYQAADRGDSITNVALVHYIRQAKGEPRMEVREIIPITKVTDTQVVCGPSRRFHRRNGENVQGFGLRAVPCTPDHEQKGAEYKAAQVREREERKRDEERRTVEREQFYINYTRLIRSAKTDKRAEEILREAVTKACVEGAG